MQAIRAGDLYFLQSPFSSGIVKDAIGTSQMEKRLSYLLGTVSSRPAVVIRPPAWWDRYNTVTVIPALSKGKPAYVCKLDDRYGFETEAEYPFVPHNPHTIPVSRLGRHIGSLSADELAELLYAYKWIHDPLMQEDTTLPVPDIYRDVWNKKHIPPSWKDNRDARADVRISLNERLEVTSETNPELNGFRLGDAIGGIFTDPAFVHEPDFIPTESVLPDSTHTKEEISMSSKKNAVPVEKAFPASIFSNNDLWKVASRFTIDDKFYDGDVETRDPVVLNGAELDKIFGDSPRHLREDIMDIYRKMTPFDAYILGPRLPLLTLAGLLDIRRNDTHMLKMLCNTMRDMEQSEYDSRLNALHGTANKTSINADARDADKAAPDKIDMGAAAEHLSKIRQYLNAKSIMNIPAKYVDDFLATPAFMVQRAWKGPQFKANYQKAVTRYATAKKEG